MNFGIDRLFNIQQAQQQWAQQQQWAAGKSSMFGSGFFGGFDEK